MLDVSGRVILGQKAEATKTLGKAKALL